MIKRLIVSILGIVFSSVCLSSYQGSGFFINHQGDIATARHMVESNNNSLVVYYEGKEYNAVIKAISRTEDIAIIHIDVINKFSFNLIPYNKSDPVYVIGFPYTSHNKLIVTFGVPKDEGALLGVISPGINACGGNSGGPIVDITGNAVGVLVSGYDLPGTQCSRDSQAVPIQKIIDLAMYNKIPLDSLNQVIRIKDIVKNSGVVEIIEYVNGN